jgi:ketosteroid isomerase-like protein
VLTGGEKVAVASNAQVIREHFAGKQSLDRSALESQFTEDAKYWPPVSGAQRGLAARPVTGGCALAEMLTTLSLKLYHQDRAWNIEYLVADDRVAAAQVELVTALTSNGAPYKNTYVYFFRLEDGKIAEIWEHLDTAWAFQQFDATRGGTPDEKQP